jgi:hypothetical protein
LQAQYLQTHDMYNALRDAIMSHLGVAVTLFSAIWAIVIFRRNNRIKAAEILLNIEKEYSRHIPALLELEHLRDYDRMYRPALKIAVRESIAQYTSDQSAAINRLEAVLRHFAMCAHVRRLGVDAGAIDRLCAWYLRVMVTDVDENGHSIRPELREYIRRYWPTLYLWAPLAPAPWPRRLLIRCGQLNERLKFWWSGSWAQRRGSATGFERLRQDSSPEPSGKMGRGGTSF